MKPFSVAVSPRLLLPLAIALGVTALLLVIRGIAFGLLDKGKGKRDRSNSHADRKPSASKLPITLSPTRDQMRQCGQN